MHRALAMPLDMNASDHRHPRSNANLVGRLHVVSFRADFSSGHHDEPAEADGRHQRGQLDV